MNLIVDIGNTRTKLGVFDKKEIKYTTVWEKGWSLSQLKKFIKSYKINSIAVSTVAGLAKPVDNYLEANHPYLKLSHKTALPITNLYKTPQTLGRDRLASVVGANALYPKSNCLVIDAGTCIKYDLITKDKKYLGGNIAPGIEMRLRAMHHMTAALPLVKRRKGQGSYGTSTITAIRNGGQLGALMEVEGFIRNYRKEFSSLKVILTGGDADYFANHLKTKIFVRQFLVLIGLNEILIYNAQNL